MKKKLKNTNNHLSGNWFGIFIRTTCTARGAIYFVSLSRRPWHRAW